MKYIIHKTDLFICGKLIPEGTEIELTKVQTKGIEEFLQPFHSEPDSSNVDSQKKLNTKGNKK
ncbi:MAG: hypothetical protein D8M26_00660 [Ignavibacteriae bacterium]|nr:hypothetical protein [Ignavibacteriota bacterium]